MCMLKQDMLNEEYWDTNCTLKCQIQEIFMLRKMGMWVQHALKRFDVNAEELQTKLYNMSSKYLSDNDNYSSDNDNDSDSSCYNYNNTSRDDWMEEDGNYGYYRYCCNGQGD